jgi:ABC-2 type transport system permease protein
VLPFEYVAQAVRDTLTTPPDGIAILPFAVLAAWCTAGLTITLRAMTRRD